MYSARFCTNTTTKYLLSKTAFTANATFTIFYCYFILSNSKTMSSSQVYSHRRKHKPPKGSEEGRHESEYIHLLKNKRKSYIAGITKVINAITELIDQKGSFSDFSKFDKVSLASYSKY